MPSRPTMWSNSTSLTHFPSQPWELDVGEWECASGTALVPNCPWSSTSEMSQVEEAENCRDSTAERQVPDSNRHNAFSKQRKCRDGAHRDARVQCKTRASRIRHVTAGGRSAHDVAKQVAMIREHRQDRRTRCCNLPSRGTRAPTANLPSRSSRVVMLEEARIHGTVNYHKAILMKTEMKRTAWV